MTDLLQQFAAIPLWLQAVSTLPTTLLTWSILEYASHRWPMHRKTPWPLTGLFARHLGSHAVLHHGRYFRDSLEPKLAILDPAIQHVDMKVDGLRNVGLSAPFWLPLGYFVSWPAALTFAAVGLLQGLAWSAVHWQFHFRTGHAGPAAGPSGSCAGGMRSTTRTSGHASVSCWRQLFRSIG